ncbi:hypothetical protein D3C72_2281910 [compost metagenome]
MDGQLAIYSGCQNQRLIQGKGAAIFASETTHLDAVCIDIRDGKGVFVGRINHALEVKEMFAVYFSVVAHMVMAAEPRRKTIIVSQQ